MLEPALHWRLRSSLIDYLTGLPDGEVRVSDGAAIDSSGRFHFANGDRGPRTIRWNGRVKLCGHHGMMHIEFKDPELCWAGPSPTLLALCWDPVEETWGQAALATLRPHDEPRPTVGEWVADARLHDEGAELLGRMHYWEGQPLDVVTVRA
ncbi:HtaA domain-containing protein [Nocardioides sp. NPDC023903]|uniref:HtaA domain-containing protein n=1 Tax=Nocardioides sp. NPDC023903 TaxID=3157195 RepID=UPI003411926F